MVKFCHGNPQYATNQLISRLLQTQLYWIAEQIPNSKKIFSNGNSYRWSKRTRLSLNWSSSINPLWCLKIFLVKNGYLRVFLSILTDLWDIKFRERVTLASIRFFYWNTWRRKFIVIQYHLSPSPLVAVKSC